MPKRRMTPKRQAQIRLWQKASYSAPRGLGGTYGGRRHKYMGKAGLHKGVGSRVTIAPAAQQIMAGKPVTHLLTTFAPAAIHGDVTQRGGHLMRHARAVDPHDLGHGLAKAGAPFGKSPRGGRLAPGLNAMGVVHIKPRRLRRPKYNKSGYKPVKGSDLVGKKVGKTHGTF